MALFVLDSSRVRAFGWKSSAIETNWAAARLTILSWRGLQIFHGHTVHRYRKVPSDARRQRWQGVRLRLQPPQDRALLHQDNLLRRLGLADPLLPLLAHHTVWGGRAPLGIRLLPEGRQATLFSLNQPHYRHHLHSDRRVRAAAVDENKKLHNDAGSLRQASPQRALLDMHVDFHWKKRWKIYLFYR